MSQAATRFQSAWDGGEGGQNSSKGSFVRKEIRDDGQAERLVALRGADQGYVSGGGAHGFGDAEGERTALPGQESFVAAHPGAASPRQNETSPAHREMIPSYIPRPSVLPEERSTPRSQTF